MTKAHLFYVMGPSGAGKDSLLAYARERLDTAACGTPPVLFAHRYITRAPAHGENHIALTHAEFAQRRALGCFALDWESHDCRYGVGVEIDAWMAAGANVVVNGSRAFLGRAVRRYGERLHLVEVRVDPQVRALRLARRGRETGDALHKRVTHRVAWTPPDGVPLTVVSNDGALAEAGDRLVAVLTSPGKG
ncbi:phosphonate metabolism protein/1,5-bisphosphokinase (PRPP-forming) PhnN [Pandoraea nosoerga]|uniref:Ribose 1,5-bisphosphate phosphokinase PhnN n=1 Tax=Pandoraea nosoerga TaxID=2508296 RepID=A0A5E4RML2_9BURK|nr:phosphonate metabolism protein/1,5-bisphosphokinase (PRPP-forming) PhnN [Pandoraea nosoerga]MBN4664527.1 phosphonate metabolism protein/1,5-bisphosphokinase (PRPP-forming) PhnN [Pandoraea nosoerga]MBN4674437.1 phosphonate metabolism protein/1,5-bisphosphokinase (PRPP-forming) PhnN [Pandoraea nosoerga]MBN4679705.1 phosphonate metabolism protein/1,5-bisphosphokinase (PRPP-forming) PhnN [Pandoraea nosoerga]MBN4743206.1 phosphonate metabolism protein/1,5-bisphosphokinase (PRPP-forming) PhnN [Pan